LANRTSPDTIVNEVGGANGRGAGGSVANRKFTHLPKRFPVPKGGPEL